MREQTLAEDTFEVCSKTTPRAALLADGNRAMPWSELCAVIAP
jgi:IS5 family transposase